LRPDPFRLVLRSVAACPSSSLVRNSSSMRLRNQAAVSWGHEASGSCPADHRRDSNRTLRLTALAFERRGTEVVMASRESPRLRHPVSLACTRSPMSDSHRWCGRAWHNDRCSGQEHNG
jgi:hypothetical protein